MTPQFSMSVATLALLLSACGGSGSSTCGAGFAGAAVSSSTSGCAGCRVDGVEAAIDGNGGTAAELVFNASGLTPAGGQIRLTGSGREFGGGSTVGAYMQFPYLASGGYTNIAVSFTTYRGGVQQEVIEGSSTAVGNIDGAGETRFYGGRSNLPFDSVEALTSLSGGGQPTTVQLFELCGNR